MRPILEAVRPLFAFVWLFVITLIWSLYSRNGIINLEPRILFLLFGTLFSNIASRLIVAQMSDTRCDAFNILMWPLVATVAISCFPWYKQLWGVDIAADTERWIVQALTIFVTIAHIHYGQGVVREMCDHFNIRCFKLIDAENDKNVDDVRRNPGFTEPTPCSKNQLKKQRKLAQYLETRVASRKELKRRQITSESSSSENVRIAIDLDYDDIMLGHDIAKCVKQCLRIYTINRRSEKSAQLHFTGIKTDGNIHAAFKKNHGWENWHLKYHFDESHLEAFPKEQLVYLTSESDTILQRLDVKDVYVIGGLVDHNHHKNLCHARATKAGLRTARLPLGEYVDMKTRLLPKWLAPNIITFIGFLLTVVNFLLIAYYDWDFTAANNEENTIPSWVWSVAAINILLYYNLDGMDGKQARRTGTSGPLGELFDHGLDSYSAGLIPIYMFSLFGTDDLPPIRMFSVLWTVFLNFYLTHVEKYNTGVMFLPWAYDVTMWGVSLTMFITTLLGPSIWHYRIFFGLSMANMFEFVLIGSGIVTSHPIILKNIYMYVKITNTVRAEQELEQNATV
uniref:SAM-dependent MTase TRM10-type domain-containing protein n=1 Tax=Glossina austeni TaxID=7395 RepID=A0A1A9V854_GLOAU